ncbi:hypothetical protein SFC65_19815 [Priestia filamentosa]|uniref:hypothetical protein n=1 Tax=Priestia filamentosa TaxID=1402861 RepID=UPI003982AA67
MTTNTVDYLRESDKLDPELEEILELLKEDTSGSIERATLDNDRLFLSAQNEEESNKVILRFHSKRKDKLTLAKVRFINRRKGNCTELVNILMRFAKRNGYKFLEIESVNSDEMESFVIKHHFQREESLLAAFGMNRESDNWIKEII